MRRPTDLLGSERRSPPSGLPILSTEPLNQAEREALTVARRSLQLAADRIDEALRGGKVCWAIDACSFAGDVGVKVTEVGVTLGARR